MKKKIIEQITFKTIWGEQFWYVPISKTVKWDYDTKVRVTIEKIKENNFTVKDDLVV